MLCVFQQNYRYLDLLNVLCVCDGVAIPDNQNYITERWLRCDRVSTVTTLRKLRNLAMEIISKLT